MRDNKFIVVVPVYNAEQYIRQCLESILTQTYKNYKLVVVDDHSTDSTLNIIDDIIVKSNFSFWYLKNNNRIASPVANIIKGIKTFSDDNEDIIVTVDGDDWLSDDNVLNYLNQVYQDDGVYMTYGQYEPLSHTYHNYCRPVINFRTYRKQGYWVTSHLRTFKRKVWDLIKDEDLRNTDGEYYKFATDLAWIYPLLEICGRKHTRFIDKVLYIYNDLNPANEMRIAEAEQLRIAAIIRSKKEYDEIQ